MSQLKDINYEDWLLIEAAYVRIIFRSDGRVFYLL